MYVLSSLQKIGYVPNRHAMRTRYETHLVYNSMPHKLDMIMIYAYILNWKMAAGDKYQTQ